MIDRQKRHKNDKEYVQYERIIQKLEADVRGHFKLEHEMKIHMDYLEGKIEQLVA